MICSETKRGIISLKKNSPTAPPIAPPTAAPVATRASALSLFILLFLLYDVVFFNLRVLFRFMGFYFWYFSNNEGFVFVFLVNI